MSRMMMMVLMMVMMMMMMMMIAIFMVMVMMLAVNIMGRWGLWQAKGAIEILCDPDARREYDWGLICIFTAAMRRESAAGNLTARTAAAE
eukprot:4996931-Karenia_brevis.AAC.1